MDKWLKRRKLNDDNTDNDNVSNQINESKPGTSKDTSCSKNTLFIGYTMMIF